MPIYEYQCKQCHHRFELIQKITDAVTTHCEQCGQDAAERLVSAPGFQLKGTGWYVTDFKDKKTPTAAGSSGDSSAKTGGAD
jgi:putative FmdB family regulatory protein